MIRYRMRSIKAAFNRIGKTTFCENLNQEDCELWWTP